MTKDEFIKIFGACPFEMVMKGHKFTDPEILIISDSNGRTIAHEMAQEGYEFTNPKILKLADNNNITVAHEMAFKGYKFDEKRQKNILKLRFKSPPKYHMINHYISVAQYQHKWHNLKTKSLIKYVDTEINNRIFDLKMKRARSFWFTTAIIVIMGLILLNIYLIKLTMIALELP